MDIATQRQKAETFRKMHDRSKILVLPNAWDVASAKIFEAAGFRAIATTSSGVANSLGYPDGEAVSRDEMLAVIARIARALTVPLSADIESGYAPDVEALKATIRAVIEAGAVGINLEDGMHDGSHQLFPVDSRGRAHQGCARGGGFRGRSDRHQRTHRCVPARDRREVLALRSYRQSRQCVSWPRARIACSFRDRRTPRRSENSQPRSRDRST